MDFFILLWFSFSGQLKFVLRQFVQLFPLVCEGSEQFLVRTTYKKHIVTIFLPVNKSRTDLRVGTSKVTNRNGSVNCRAVRCNGTEPSCDTRYRVGQRSPAFVVGIKQSLYKIYTTCCVTFAINTVTVTKQIFAYACSDHRLTSETTKCCLTNWYSILSSVSSVLRSCLEFKKDITAELYKTLNLESIALLVQTFSGFVNK